MPEGLIARSSEGLFSFSLGTRTRRLLFLVLCIVFFLLGFGYHLLAWNLQQPPAASLTAVYHVVTLACYGILWVFLAHLHRDRQSSPPRIFWRTLLVGVTVLTICGLLSAVGRSPGVGAVPGFAYETGIPLVLATVVKMNVYSLLGAVFAFVLLLHLRDLVLFKRTKRSQRNWYLLLGAMLLTSLAYYFQPPNAEEPAYLMWITMVPTVILMLVNAFRASWIVFQPFREKMISIGLATLLFIFLVGGIGLGEEVSQLLPGLYVHILYYSYPLSIFIKLSVAFGIIYTLASVLLLFFHLPTTGDFQRRSDERAAMQALSNLVNQVFDPERLYVTIAASPVEAGSAQTSWLAMSNLHSGSLRPRIVATSNITPGRVDRLIDTQALYQEVLGSREPLLLEQASADHRMNVRPGDGFGSLLAVPLIARDEVIGALFVTKEVNHGFETDDVEAIRTFASQAALALDNARLFEEQVEKERLQRELDIAREVQRKLLPQRLPAVEGVTLAASNVSAAEVGGDYYDFIELSDRRLGFIIGDVSGKGASAAFYMAEMQGIFQALSRIVSRPVDFLIHANAALAGSLEKNVFISVIYGILDPQKERLVLARAGHCPAATINLHGDARYLRSPGLGLGLDRGALFEKTLQEECIHLEPGDVLVLYTDGVVESRNADGEEYGYERLLDALREHRHEDAPDLHDALLRDLHTFLGHEAYDDDMTLVVLKWHGIGLAHEARPAREEAGKSVPARASLVREES